MPWAAGRSGRGYSQPLAWKSKAARGAQSHSASSQHPATAQGCPPPSTPIPLPSRCLTGVPWLWVTSRLSGLGAGEVPRPMHALLPSGRPGCPPRGVLHPQEQRGSGRAASGLSLSCRAWAPAGPCSGLGRSGRGRPSPQGPLCLHVLPHPHSGWPSRAGCAGGFYAPDGHPGVTWMVTEPHH